MQMRRLSGALMAGALFMLPAFSQSAFAQESAAQPAAQETKKPAGAELKYSGDTVIVAYAVNPGKEADYEKVLTLLKDGLAKNPARAAQAAGWKIFKSEKPLTADGAPVYIHVISPVDKSADYSITNIVYESLADDQAKIDFFNLYKGALMKPLMQLQGPAVK
jgi:hypothetical protein